jgi:tetratricopeptide (TPR) repeat protein
MFKPLWFTMRIAAFALFLLCFSVQTWAQNPPAGFDLSNYGVRIEPDKRLMVVLATIEAANDPAAKDRVLNTPLSEANQKFREKLAADSTNVPDDLRRKIETFLVQHKKRNAGLTDAQILASFMSMAYTLSPVPELADPVLTGDLPGPVLDVLDFAPLVREYYRRSGIAAHLDAYAKEYQADADVRLRPSVREMVGELLDYLHTRPRTVILEKVTVQTQKSKGKTALQKVETREHERHFVVVPEKLVPKGNVNFLNIRDDYYVIAPPDANLSSSDARRAFLQYVIDPLVMAYSKEIDPIRTWAKPLLDEKRKSDPFVTPDVYLAITRSLVSAVDIRQTEYSLIQNATNQTRERLARMDEEFAKKASPTETEKARHAAAKKAVTDDLSKLRSTMADEAVLRLYEDYEKGAVLSFYFAEQLRGIEDAGFDIASSMKEMIVSFDPLKEANRMADTAEARKRAAAARLERKKNPDAVASVVEDPVTTRLLEIQKLVDAKNYSKAEQDLKQMLGGSRVDPRVYYNLGRVASLMAGAAANQDAEAQKLIEAKAAYSNVLSTAGAGTDKALLSLTYVALGRIYEYFDQNDYALKLYDKAIELSEVAGGAYREAVAAKQRLIKPR